jgi:hypothetical protein
MKSKVMSLALTFSSRLVGATITWLAIAYGFSILLTLYYIV